ncbi:unnamed protein product [Adineta steineri]|uniref:Uncharacterized protein n=1 Tax=Adineta steineri TaxID=433720 RepID=A0A819DQ74_9BILA|nr:unnamed protein product [Adineta steineri]CAF3839303.1 unnamed protein product [Adineta steineri]
MSFCFGLFVITILIVVTVNGMPSSRLLTEAECKAYLSSDDINQQLQALFVCPKKWRLKMKKPESIIAKRSINNMEDNDNELDDLYLYR